MIPFLTTALCIGAASWVAAGEFVLSRELVTVQSPGIQEASGLAFSQRDSRLLWAINDSGGTAEIHLLDLSGRDRGKVHVEGAENIDWEDIAAFQHAGERWLLIADTGDNQRKRTDCQLHLVREPELPKNGAPIGGRVKVERSISFTWEDGPKDCEAVAVDPKAGQILLLSKRTKPPTLYQIPLRPAAGVPVVARKVGGTRTDSPAGTLLPFSNQPVGMDLAADGSFAAVVTYYSVFLFPRSAGQTWAQAFAGKARVLAAHGLGQAESVAIAPDGKSIMVVSEGRRSPIRIYQR